MKTVAIVGFCSITRNADLYGTYGGFFLDTYDFLSLKKDVDKNVEIVCFGAGMLFYKYVLEIEKIFSKTIAYVVDNDRDKIGREIEVGGKKYKVNSVESLVDEKDDFIMIITCADNKTIVRQIGELNSDIRYYRSGDILEAYHVWKAKTVVLPRSFRLVENPIIPKVIHYCWFGKGKLPDRYREWMKSWKKYCPDYEIIEWNESNYDVYKNKYIGDAYRARKWAFVSDYARLDVIYEHGGIYLDVDVELLKNLDELLYAKGFIGFELFNCVDTGLGFGAVRNLPVIGEMRDIYNSMTFLDFVDEADYKKKRRSGQMKLCTDYQTDVLKRHGLVSDSFVFQQIADLQVYPVPVLCGMVHSKNVLTSNTYSIHHYAASWLK